MPAPLKLVSDSEAPLQVDPTQSRAAPAPSPLAPEAPDGSRVFSAETVREATEWVFSEDGPMAGAGWEIRPSQRTLALAVADRIDAGSGWSLGEAPCGTGKGLAYLIPGIIGALREEREWRRSQSEWTFPKVVVSTANIALQGQLVNKDIPGVAKLLGVRVNASLVKGRNNYLCLSKIQESGLMSGDRNVRRLVDWSKQEGCSGDREDLDWDPGRAWHEVSVQSKDCHGKRCAFAQMNPETGRPACFSERARGGRRFAHVVIVNHHMLGLMKAIPSVVLAVDEAHELEDCVRGARARSFTRGSGVALAGRAAKFIGEAEAQSKIRQPIEALFDALDRWADRVDLRYSEELVPGWQRAAGVRTEVEDLKLLRKAATEIRRAARGLSDDELAAKGEKLAEAVAALGDGATSACAGTVEELVVRQVPGPWAMWVEARGQGSHRRLSVNLSPADVAPEIHELQANYPAAMLTSATLTADGSFDFMLRSLGMNAQGKPAVFADALKGSGDLLKAEGPVECLELPSPYPLESMGVIVVPGDAPSPKQYQTWSRWAPDAVWRAVRASKGRALILASSYRMVRAYADHLSTPQLGYRVLVQGESGRAELLREFRDDTSSILIGTRSFYQGVDVQGEALSLVVIDRIPFSAPGDPLEEAVEQLHVERATRQTSGFWLRAFPKACMLLSQASGRLIRSQSDRGAIVCLDSRIATGRMGRSLRGAMPPFPLSRSLDDVGRVLAGEPIEAPARRPVAGGRLSRFRR